MKKSIQKKSSKSKMKRLVMGGLATATLLTSMAFVGCADKTPVNPNPDNGNNNGSSPVIIQTNHATSVSDLLARYAEETEAFIATQFDTVLSDLGVEDDISADYKINSNEQGVTSIRYTFEYNHQKYTAFASYSSPVEFDTIANYNKTKEHTSKANSAIENSTTQYDTQDILIHVSTYQELEENYPTKLTQYLKTQFEYVLEKYNIKNDKDTPVSNISQNITTNENGITNVEFTFTQDNKEQTIKIAYTTPISLDAIANYPEHEASKEEVVNAIITAKSEHEIATPTYTDEYILANFQDQINANLYSGVQACVKDYCDGMHEKYDESKITYQWRFGNIENSTIQNLQLYVKYGVDIFVYNVSLKSPIALSDLAKENNAVEFKKITFDNNVYVNGYVERVETQYANYKEAINKQLAQKDPTFDYLNADSKLGTLMMGGYSIFQVIYQNDSEIRTMSISVNGDNTSTDEHLLKTLLQNLENGNFTYKKVENRSFVLEGNALEWATPQIEAEKAQ